jgi:hypothetical protein
MRSRVLHDDVLRGDSRYPRGSVLTKLQPGRILYLYDPLALPALSMTKSVRTATPEASASAYGERLRIYPQIGRGQKVEFGGRSGEARTTILRCLLTVRRLYQASRCRPQLVR